MTLRILVVGLRGVDSGKTTLAASLLRHLGEMGVDAAPFKPIGSTDAWLHPESVRWSAERGILVTPDAMRLVNAAPRPEPLEAVEPVAGLHVPPDPSRYQWDPWFYSATLSNPNATAAILRVTTCRSEGLFTVHFIDTSRLSRTPQKLGGELERLASRLLSRILLPADSIERVLGQAALEAADSCLHMLSSRHEVLVIESYSDVAAPTPGSLESDIVVAVSPGVAALIDASRYSKAVQLKMGSGGLSAVTAGEAVHLAGVSETVYLPLLEEPEEGYPREALEPIIDRIVKML